MYFSTLLSVSNVTLNRLIEEPASELAEESVELERGDVIGFEFTLSEE